MCRVPGNGAGSRHRFRRDLPHQASLCHRDSGRRLGRLLYEGKWYDPEAMMLKDALTRWVAPSVSGSVTLELRRGDDYTILDTQATYMAYEADKLSMEKVEQAYFTQEDRIGALEMQNLSLMDNRAFLLHHLDSVKRLGAPADNVLGKLLSGDADDADDADGSEESG